MRRAAVSVASNIVEGNARRSTPEYVNFLNIARGSAAEVAYLISLSSELGYFSPGASESLRGACDQLLPQLEVLVQKMELLMKGERNQRPKTKD